MATIYYDKDADLGRLAGRKIAVIGYGSQGHAHALNLRDSGVDVRVGLYPDSKSWSKAEAAGLTVMSVDQAAAGLHHHQCGTGQVSVQDIHVIDK